MAKIFGISNLPVSTIDKTIMVGGDVQVPVLGSGKMNNIIGLYNPRSIDNSLNKSYTNKTSNWLGKVLDRIMKTLRK